ncbi:MAG: pyruvate kinase alpha/beta domain-containing protein [Candidatus Heimdallarchaeota archaeon]
MSEVETIVYFEKPGPENTEKALKLAYEYAEEYKIPKVIISSSKGATAVKALDIFTDLEKLVIVTHVYGFIKSGENEFDAELLELLKKKNIAVLTTTHALAGVDRAVRRKHNTWQIAELIAEVYRTFGQGTKVCAEITLMAADSGLIPIDQDILAVGGTGRGVDTVWQIKPANTFNFFDLRMKKCLCKPVTTEK